MVPKPVIEGKFTPAVFAGILKKIEGNRGAAYLLVSDGLSEKCLYFSVGAIRLSSMGRRRTLSLEELLWTSAKIDPASLARAEERRKGCDRDRPIEDVLSDMGFDDVVREASAQIVRDELLDLIVWEGAFYEYCEANPPPKIFDPRLAAVKLSTGVSKQLKEAEDGIARATKLFAKIGGTRVRLIRGATAAHGPPGGADPRAAAALMEVVGEAGATADEAILACRRCGIDALAAVSALDALIESRGLEIQKTASQRLSKEEEIEQAKREAEEIEAALDLLINEIVARQRLAARYQTIGDERKAAENLRKVGEELALRNRAEEAIETFREVLKLVPADFGARERIVQLYEKLKRIPEALSEGIELARSFARFGLLNRARNVYRHLIAIDPLRIDLRRELIELLVKLRDTKAAIAEYEDLAEIFRDQDEDEQLLACFQQILKLDPTHKVARARLQKVARRSLAYVVPYVGVAAGFLFLAGTSAWVAVSYGALRDWKAMRVLAYERADRDDYAGAYQAIAEFVAKRDWGRERVLALRREISDMEADRRLRRAAEDYGRARALEGAKRVMEARSSYLSILASGRGTIWEAKAQERLKAIEIEIEQSERLAASVQRLYQDKKDREAYERARDLVRRYGWSEAAAQCQAPLEIRSVPPGATIAVNQREKTSRTPAILPLRLAAPVTLQLSLAGFQTEARILDLREEVPFPYEIELRKQLRWKGRTLGPIDAPPAPGLEGAIVAARDERVHAFAADGRRRWSRPLGVFADPIGRPLRGGERAVVADRMGQVTAIDVGSGEVRWRERFSGGAATVAAPPGGRIAVVSVENGRSIAGLDFESGKERWRVDAPGGALAVPAAAAEGDRVVLAAGADATLFAIDATDGRFLAKVATRARAVAPPALCAQGFFVATEDGLLRLIARGGEEIWRAALPAAATAAPVFADGIVYVAAGETLFALEGATGAEKWRQPFRAPIRAPPAARAGRLYVGAADGALYALAAETGALRWVFRTGGEIAAQPLVDGDTVYLASADNTVYAIAD
jgi:outer membrane protein assembly factor BamB/tetratricopeptide (TPR) repeat protein